MNAPNVWWSNGRVVTRNADGGTTGWTHADAVDLHKRLGEIIEASGIGFQVDEVEEETQSGGITP